MHKSAFDCSKYDTERYSFNAIQFEMLPNSNGQSARQLNAAYRTKWYGKVSSWCSYIYRMIYSNNLTDNMMFTFE